MKMDSLCENSVNFASKLMHSCLEWFLLQNRNWKMVPLPVRKANWSLHLQISRRIKHLIPDPPLPLTYLPTHAMSLPPRHPVPSPQTWKVSISLWNIVVEYSLVVAWDNFAHHAPYHLPAVAPWPPFLSPAESHSGGSSWGTSSPQVASQRQWRSVPSFHSQ